MKKSARMFMLSCLAVTVLGPAAMAQTQEPANVNANTMASLNALNAANAASSYTGNPALVQQMTQPGQVIMTPTGMQLAPLMGPPPPAQEQQEVKMRYNKKEMEGVFYGVQLPKRLFENVPSDW